MLMFFNDHKLIAETEVAGMQEKNSPKEDDTLQCWYF